MKKNYTTPSIEFVAYCTENMMALSLLEQKANDTDALSNNRTSSIWDEETDD